MLNYLILGAWIVGIVLLFVSLFQKEHPYRTFLSGVGIMFVTMIIAALT